MKYTHWRKSDGWLYVIFHPAVERVMLAAYPKIHLNGIEKVPTDRPVLLASNHPTAFADPLFLCIFLDPPIYNMTRGDIFQRPFFRWLLFQINMFPVFRQRDGYTDRDRNNEVFEYCFRQLKAKRALTIYVEGEHHLEKHVKPIQKGIVRIAFGALEKENLENLTILPVGVNYCLGDHLPDEVMMNVGEPIAVQPFFEKLKNGEKNALSELTQTIWKGLEAVCFHLQNKEDEPLADQLLTLHRSNHPQPLLPVLVKNSTRFQKEKQILQKINHLPDEQKMQWKVATDQYFKKLDAVRLQDFALVQKKWGNFSFTTFLLATMPIFLLGYFATRPMAWAVKFVLKKVKKREFITSVMIGVATLTAVLIFSILLIFGWLKFGWCGILTAIGIALSMQFYFFYKNLLIKWRSVWKANRHPKLLELQQQRQELLQILQFLE